MREKVLNIINELEKRLIEREVAARISILAIFCKEHVFMIGERGVAKSYMIKLLNNIVEDFKYWELQVGSDTTAEQLLGEKIIKDGAVQYASEKSMLSADLAFLDEMFKAKTEVLNTILQLLVDRYYTTGDGRQIPVKLNSVFGASNEFPTSHDALAYVDRFLFWLEISRIKKKENRLKYFNGDYIQEGIEEPLITREDIDTALEESAKIQFSEQILNVFERITSTLIKYEVKTSDRKYKNITKAIKMSAYLNGRDYINYSDLFLFLFTAWHNYLEKQNVEEVVYSVIFETKETIDNINEDVKKHKEVIETEIKGNFYDYLNYNKSFVGEHKTEFFQNVRTNIEMIKNAIIQSLERIQEVIEFYKFVKDVEQEIEDNIFIPNYKNRTFTKDNFSLSNQLLSELTQDYNEVDSWLKNTDSLFKYNQIKAKKHEEV